MSVRFVLIAAILLGIERICYVTIAGYPGTFQRIHTTLRLTAVGEPIVVVRDLFYCFKVLQLSVFLAWFYLYGADLSSVGGLHVPILVVSIALMVAGQILNFGVFMRLGRTGVFYGNRFGYEIPWREEFPFSWLRHPQYVGTVISIWGLFLILSLARGDWYVLPTLETAYYALGAYLEG